MIDFILGEHRHVKYYVHAGENEYVVVKSARYELLYKGIPEVKGDCVVERHGNGVYLDIMLEPKMKSQLYELVLILEIADERRIHKEKLEVC